MLKKGQFLSLLMAILHAFLPSWEKHTEFRQHRKQSHLGFLLSIKTPVVKIQSGDTVSMETWNSCLHEMVFNKTTPADVAKFYIAT